MHDYNIVHRLIKPENLILDDNTFNGTVKIIGFGNSELFDDSFKVDNYFYLSPEALNGQFCVKSDIWSCGVLLYIMLNGTYPFDGKS